MAYGEMSNKIETLNNSWQGPLSQHRHLLALNSLHDDFHLYTNDGREFSLSIWRMDFFFVCKNSNNNHRKKILFICLKTCKFYCITISNIVWFDGSGCRLFPFPSQLLMRRPFKLFHKINSTSCR